jgi:hypothetical protein
MTRDGTVATLKYKEARKEGRTKKRDGDSRENYPTRIETLLDLFSESVRKEDGRQKENLSRCRAPPSSDRGSNRPFSKMFLRGNSFTHAIKTLGKNILNLRIVLFLLVLVKPAPLPPPSDPISNFCGFVRYCSQQKRLADRQTTFCLSLPRCGEK